MNKFESGDIVRLRKDHHAPLMTVNRSEDNWVYVDWFEGDEYHWTRFRSEKLVLVERQ